MLQIFDFANYYFNPHAIPPFFVATFIIIQAFYVFSKNSTSSVNFSFLLLGLSVFLWLFGNAVIYSCNQNPEVINFWCKYCIAFGVIFSPANFYFFSVSTVKSLNRYKWRVVFSYLVSLFFFILMLKGEFFFLGARKYYWGWYSQYGPTSFPFLMFFALMVFFSTKGYLSKLKELPSGIERTRIKYVFASISAALFCFIDILPAYGIVIYPFGFLFILIFGVFIAFAIVRYKLMKITAALAADTIIDTMTDSLVVFGPQKNILMINRATMDLLGYKRNELIGKDISMLFAEKDLFADESLDKFIINNAAKDYELTYVTKNNEKIPVRLNAGVIKDKLGEILGNVCIIRDIRKTKKLEAQLIQSAKMGAVGQLGAGVAHELNNPLGGILGYAQFMLDKISRPDFTPEDFKSCKGFIESIERESIRCKKIVSSLLRFSRKSVIDRLELIDISQTIEETLAMLEHQLKMQNINTIVNIQPNLSKVMGVSNLLQQVFTNLILNAQQAMVRGGNLTINAKNVVDEEKQAVKSIKVEFIDTGCGIPAENLTHIFEPFFTTKTEKGTGLGLSISYKIIQDHKGEIDVKSQVGKGTVFTITLPVAEVDPKAQP